LYANIANIFFLRLNHSLHLDKLKLNLRLQSYVHFPKSCEKSMTSFTFILKNKSKSKGISTCVTTLTIHLHIAGNAFAYPYVVNYSGQ